jgi:hypothetical protein
VYAKRSIAPQVTALRPRGRAIERRKVADNSRSRRTAVYPEPPSTTVRHPASQAERLSYAHARRDPLRQGRTAA